MRTGGEHDESGQDFKNHPSLARFDREQQLDRPANGILPRESDSGKPPRLVDRGTCRIAISPSFAATRTARRIPLVFSIW